MELVPTLADIVQNEHRKLKVSIRKLTLQKKKIEELGLEVRLMTDDSIVVSIMKKALTACNGQVTALE